MDWNRNYRILWSEARRAWVVADERAGTLGKGKSRGVVSRLVCAMLVASGMLASVPEASALTGSCGPGASTTITRALNGACIAAAPGDSITLSNTGSITGGTASAVFGSSVIGIGFGANMTGTLINNGTIAALPNTNAMAKGIKVAIDISGSLTNNGTVKVKAVSSSASANAIGIRASGIVAGGTLSNTGAIQVTASGTGTTAMGIRVRNGMNGSLTNSGTVKVKAAKGGGNVAGIGIGAIGPGSTMANSGTVQLTVGKRGLGINVSGLSGSLTNSGKVLASANGASRLKESVTGVRVTMNSGSTLTNSGAVTATVNNTLGGAGANGLSIVSPFGFGGVGGGTVSLPAASAVKAMATAGGSAAATALGVFVGIPVATGSTLTHSGLIQAKAKVSGSAAGAYATGLSMNAIATLNGTLSNAGTINATATGAAGAGSVRARGVAISTLTGTFTNSGTVTAKGSGTGSAVNPRISGLLITTMNAGAVINNSGTISGTASLPAKAASAYSLNVANSTGGTINNQAGGLLKGNILVKGPAQVNNAGVIEMPEQVLGSIANNYTQQAGGKLRIDASSLTSYGKLQVNGTADLTASGVIDVNVGAGSTLAVGQTLAGVLTAGTALNVPAGGLTVTDNSPTIDFQAVVNAATNTIDLKVVAQAGGGTGGGAVASGGGGGCVMRPGSGGFDPVLPALAAGAWLLGLVRRRPNRG